MPIETLYVGTHRRAHHADPVDLAFGIYALRRESGTARFTPLEMTATPQPGWIAIHPSGDFLYVVNEVKTFEGAEGGGISAFAINRGTGSLIPLNTRLTPPLPCHCEVDHTGHYLIVATFGGGTVHLFPIESDGSIGPEAESHQHTGSSVHPRRQTGPHAHAVNIDPANRFVLVPDLGIDQIVVYELDLQHGKFVPRPDRNVQLAPGSGPRHIAFGRGGRFAYLMNEMNATVTVFGYDSANGALDELQTVDLLPHGFAGLRSGAEIGIHPAGRFLYATTRSHGSSGEPPVRGLDNIVWFAIDQQNGMLNLCGRVASGGEIPRTFAFDYEGELLFVGHQCSGTVVVFHIDGITGAPIATGEVIAIPVPVCECFTVENDRRHRIWNQSRL